MTEAISDEFLRSSIDSIPTIVLCGGAGARLAGVTQDIIPKHLVDVDGRTIIEHAIEPFIDTAGLILATGVHGDQIQDFFEGKKAEFGLDVRYSHDVEPKGVVLAVLKAIREHRPESSFVITHGDEVLKGLDVQQMYDFHNEKESPITVVATGTAPAVRDFAMWRDSDGRVEELRRGSLTEQKTQGARFGVGTFICEPQAMELLKPDDSWEGYLRKLIAERQLYGFPTEAAFYNLNSLNDLKTYQSSLGRAALLDG